MPDKQVLREIIKQQQEILCKAVEVVSDVRAQKVLTASVLALNTHLMAVILGADEDIEEKPSLIDPKRLVAVCTPRDENQTFTPHVTGTEPLTVVMVPSSSPQEPDEQEEPDELETEELAAPEPEDAPAFCRATAPTFGPKWERPAANCRGCAEEFVPNTRTTKYCPACQERRRQDALLPAPTRVKAKAADVPDYEAMKSAPCLSCAHGRQRSGYVACEIEKAHLCMPHVPGNRLYFQEKR
jgi:hypothetical protein